MDTMILVDSCCDLPLSYIEAHQDHIDVIGMPVLIDGQDHIDDLGKTLKHDFLYEKLREGAMPSTASINIYQFSERFKKHVEAGKAIIYIGLSKGLSGTNLNAKQAVDMVLETHPEANIMVLESRSASIGQGILAVKAVEMAEQQVSHDEIFKWLQTNELKANHWFAVNDLNHLKNGGRISAASAAVGTLLNVKPILIVDHEGVLKAENKIKGRKKSIKYLLDKFKTYYDTTDFDKVIIGHGQALEEAEQIKTKLMEILDEDKIIITQLSATIASHVGPGMLALAFMGHERAK